MDIPICVICFKIRSSPDRPECVVYAKASISSIDFATRNPNQEQNAFFNLLEKKSKIIEVHYKFHIHILMYDIVEPAVPDNLKNYKTKQNETKRNETKTE